MEIQSLRALQQALQAMEQKRIGGSADASGGAGFGSALQDALQGVSAAQSQSVEMIRAYQSGDPAVSLEQSMISLQKAQVSFQAALTVRNRLVAAYTEIMNMQV